MLRLGSGKAGGDGGLYTRGALHKVVNDGSLVLNNRSKSVSLSRISGSGSLTQSGSATTALPGTAVTYTGRTTIKKGTLALRSGATLAHSRDVRLTSSTARLDAGTAGLNVTNTLTGKGTVKGAVTNEGVVAGSLTVAGDYSQRAEGQLVFRKRPLKVAGAVRPAGDRDLASAATGPAAREITVLEDTGRAGTTGAFKGLKEGARVQLADTTYRISYRGGDGNDVVLTATTATSPSPGASPRTAAGAAPATTRTASAESEVFGWWPYAPYALGVGLLGGLMVPATRRVRGGGPPAPGRPARGVVRNRPLRQGAPGAED